jgi:hypothetical protein
LSEPRGDAATERLVRAGKMRQLTVRYRADEKREPGGRQARGLRLTNAGQ